MQELKQELDYIVKNYSDPFNRTMQELKPRIKFDAGGATKSFNRTMQELKRFSSNEM